MSPTSPQRPQKIKAVFFDFMGTCLDWHKSVTASFPPSVSQSDASKLALEWRRRYFMSNSFRVQQDLGPEDIDTTLARTLEHILRDDPLESVTLSDAQKADFDTSETKQRMISAWHNQPAWPEVPKAIQTIRRDLGLEVFVHANGTTRLQLDLTRSSGLSFDMLFSSQLLGVYKPDPKAYAKGLELVKLQPEEVVLVAAHAYDLRGAKECGMKTIYVHRWTDDVDEDMDTVRGEFDVFLEGGMEELPAKIEAMILML
ncbi:HAD-like domain-containing protein [Apodospora peruviana]|uniref:HAD-like domain-containing protein n=1 Tax=Apodospora peruviana TaxID=516989 RepID=A0AAE0HZE0_9PEZI|nr:HAD-like domain-containing protein [Apodospora peruviana]